MLPTIDIILPNYNKQSYIKACLQSLQSQTYPHWRCIVVDANSDDGSWQTIQRVAAADSRFELYQLAPTGNLYRDWNWGLNRVDAPYFCILTSDDLWPHNWLEVAIASLRDCSEAIAAVARTRRIDDQGNWLTLPIYSQWGERFFHISTATQRHGGLLSSVANYFIGPIYTSIHSLVMRSDLLDRGMRFAEDLGSTADYQWYLRLGLYGDIIYHPQIEVGWRIYGGQATQPRQQNQMGQYIQTIHQRDRQLIAQSLGSLSADFIAAAQHYDRTVLAYHYARPYWINLRTQPLTEIPRLWQIWQTQPQQFLADLTYKLQRKNWFAEASLTAAQQFYQPLVNTNFQPPLKIDQTQK